MMAKWFLAVAMMMVLALATAPAPVFAAAQAAGSISGTASAQGGAPLGNMTAQLRNLGTKQLVGTTTTTAQGAFSFAGLNPGQYMVEIVNSQGAIVGTTSAISLSPGAMVASGVAVTATAGAIAGGAAAAGGLGSFFGTTAGIVTAVAVVGGVTAGVIAAQGSASPSR
jgi:hypothetical protein